MGWFINDIYVLKHNAKLYLNIHNQLPPLDHVQWLQDIAMLGKHAYKVLENKHSQI